MHTIKARFKLKYTFFIYTFFIIFSLGFILPFVLIVSASLTNETDLLNMGYKLIPSKVDLTAYKYVFQNPQQIMSSYKVTALQAFLGTLLSTFCMALCAYPLSRSDFAFKKTIVFYCFFTTLFGGGLIPSYIINTQYLGLRNSFWVYIFPGMVNAFQIIIFRTFFQGLPPALVESAKIDGAREYRIFFQIVFPLSKPVLATIALLQLLDRWNNWMTSLVYITDSKLYTLQYLLQKILAEAEFVKNMGQNAPPGVDFTTMKMPVESMKFAMCVVAAGPMLFIFPFFQKYFTRGLTIGAVKG